ncbi:ATP-binding cassette sub-family C member 12 isoform X1, partial [Tachysurus ichikawai]
MKANGRYAHLINNYQPEQSDEKKEEAPTSPSDSTEHTKQARAGSKSDGIVNAAFDMSDERLKPAPDAQDTKECKDQLVIKEVSQEGSVTFRTYHEYCRAAG